MAKADKFADRGFNIIKASDMAPIEYISSGIKELDEVIKFPRKRITEIYGLQAVGKTSLVLMMVANLSHDNKVLFIDVENTYNPLRAAELGVENKNLTVANPTLLEDVSDLTIDSCAKFDVIIVDSVAAMVPRAESEGEAGDAVMGLKARLMGQFMRRVNSPLSKSDCALVFINQLRENLALYTAKYSTPGGHALEYAASVRIELKTISKDKIIKEGRQVGHWVDALVTKSKVSAPYQKARFKLLYG